MAKKSRHQHNPKIAILMATYNGARFLEEQLESIAAQSCKNWKLIVSDDGSADRTLEILRRYETLWGPTKLEVRLGPCNGFAINFLTLACDKSIDGDLYAFCDQDDVWLPNKLKAAVEFLDGHDMRIPHLYGGRTMCVDENLNALHPSPLFVFPCGFRNALVQSYAGGNTMVFNLAAKRLLESAGVKNVPVHDWWTYLLVSGAGGHVHFDERPLILYRQHPNSLIGSNASFIRRLIRLLSIIRGNFRQWTDLHLAALNHSRRLLSPHSIETLEVFLRLRKGNLFQRIRMVEVCGLYRQTWRGTISLYLTAFFNKL
jgi:glycosyltransferase involved in cell wall biosynthesis